MNSRIIGVAGPFRDMVYVLPEGEACVGRDSSNQMYAADPALSRRHCTLIRTDTKVVVRDLGSRNGTRVNGVPVEEYELRDGDQISIGGSLLVFNCQDQGYPDEIADTAEFERTALELAKSEAFLALPCEPTEVAPSHERSSDLHHLKALLQLTAAIGRIRERESLQWQLLGFLLDLFRADHGAVMFLNPAGEVNSIATWDRAEGPEHPVSYSQRLVESSLRERRGILVNDASEDQALLITAESSQSQIRSALCVPLLVSEKVLGLIYLDSEAADPQFQESQLQVLTAVGEIAALAVGNLHEGELAQENQRLQAEINLEHDMIGSSPAMRRIFEFIRRVAPTDATVLIQGESGTGKELVARAIHRNSARASAPFVGINCAAITETLLESELFGHEKGSFTGALGRKRGKVEAADGGTLFLDEIGELALGLQAKLLRVLQEREFERVGGTRSIPLDIRLIAASNKDLSAAVEAGSFRQDLFYRLNVVSVTLPPLRSRREDIEAMANYFVLKAGRKCKAAPKVFSSEALACMKKYDWPGNVRELENAVERALVLGSDSTIRIDDLPDTVVEMGGFDDEPNSFHGAIKDRKRQLVQQAMQQANGSYIEAAKALGIHPNSMLRLIRNLGLKGLTKAVGPNP